MDMIIPSQKRSIGYFESYLENGLQYDPIPIVIHSIRRGTTNSFKYYHRLGKYVFTNQSNLQNVFIFT